MVGTKLYAAECLEKDKEIARLSAIIDERDKTIAALRGDDFMPVEIIQSASDEKLMRTTLLKCYGSKALAFRVSSEHYRYLAEQIVSLREHIKRTALPTLSDEPGRKAYLTKRDALYRNPNAADALAWWHESQGNIEPVDPLVPLAGVHKSRLQWLDATDDMLEQSKLWLAENGFQAEWRGAPPLTPERRDADRVSIGKRPLNETK